MRGRAGAGGPPPLRAQLEFGCCRRCKERLIARGQAVPQRAAHPERRGRSVPVDARAGGAARGAQEAERVAGDGATAFRGHKLATRERIGDARYRDPHGLEAKSAHYIAGETGDGNLSAAKLVHVADAPRPHEAGLLARMTGEHGLDAEIGREVVPRETRPIRGAKSWRLRVAGPRTRLRGSDIIT